MALHRPNVECSGPSMALWRTACFLLCVDRQIGGEWRSGSAGVDGGGMGNTEGKLFDTSEKPDEVKPPARVVLEKRKSAGVARRQSLLFRSTPREERSSDGTPSRGSRGSHSATSSENDRTEGEPVVVCSKVLYNELSRLGVDDSDEAVVRAHAAGMVRIQCISDTHDDHELLPMEACDILLHTGDFSMFYNSKRGGRRFIEWFRAQAATYRIMVCGNHDKCLYGRTHNEMKEWAGDGVEILFDSMTSVPLEGFVFEDRGGSSEKEINFYGTPWTIARGQANAFSVPSNQLEEKFKPIITSGTDVLMSHVPPYYVRDMNSGGKHTGSGALLRVLEDERVNIAMHVFGHNHDGHGVSRWEASHEEIGLKEGDESEAGGSSCDDDEDDRARRRAMLDDADGETDQYPGMTCKRAQDGAEECAGDAAGEADREEMDGEGLQHNAGNGGGRGKADGGDEAIVDKASSSGALGTPNTADQEGFAATKGDAQEATAGGESAKTKRALEEHNEERDGVQLAPAKEGGEPGGCIDGTSAGHPAQPSSGNDGKSPTVFVNAACCIGFGAVRAPTMVHYYFA